MRSEQQVREMLEHIKRVYRKLNRNDEESQGVILALKWVLEEEELGQ